MAGNDKGPLWEESVFVGESLDSSRKGQTRADGALGELEKVKAGAKKSRVSKGLKLAEEFPVCFGRGEVLQQP